MDATFWAMIALFIFLGVVIYLKVPGMIAKALDERAAKIRNELDEAQRLREEAQQLLAEYPEASARKPRRRRPTSSPPPSARATCSSRRRTRRPRNMSPAAPRLPSRRSARPSASGQRGALDRRRHRHRGGAQAACRQARRKDQRRAVQGFADGGQDQAELKPRAPFRPDRAAWRRSA